MSAPDETGANRLREISRRLRRSAQREPPPKPGPPVPSRHDAPCERCGTTGGAGAGTEVETPEGPVHVITHRLEQADPQWARIGEAFAGQLAQAQSNLRRLIARAGAPDARAEDLLFVDLETTGLEVLAPLFLIGTLQWAGDGFVVRQCLARNYDEEAAAISVFGQAAERARLLVSFNGNGFDLPFLRSRSAANRLPPPPPLPHLDLLPLCRRAWRAHLPDCRLTTLEVHICGREREGDVPGEVIPEAYHEYVRTADAGLILPVLEHNVVDLGTMADLMLRLPADDD